jgi:hypothetical protein
MNYINSEANYINFEEPTKDSITTTLEDLMAKQIEKIKTGGYTYSIDLLEVFIKAYLFHVGGM